MHMGNLESKIRIKSTLSTFIIKSNATPWICCESDEFIIQDKKSEEEEDDEGFSDKAAPEAYIIFDLSRIENEIREKCIAGRCKLRIKYQNFDFVGSKNMITLIQEIRIRQNKVNGNLNFMFYSIAKGNYYASKISSNLILFYNWSCKESCPCYS